MEQTLIQNLNTLFTTKSQLNYILNSQGVDGGDVFSTYADKFESIFSSLEELVENIIGE